MKVAFTITDEERIRFNRVALFLEQSAGGWAKELFQRNLREVEISVAGMDDLDKMLAGSGYRIQTEDGPCPEAGQQINFDLRTVAAEVKEALCQKADTGA